MNQVNDKFPSDQQLWSLGFIAKDSLTGNVSKLKYTGFFSQAGEQKQMNRYKLQLNKIILHLKNNNNFKKNPAI